jgi:hypothetical protein
LASLEVLSLEKNPKGFYSRFLFYYQTEKSFRLGLPLFSILLLYLLS